MADSSIIFAILEMARGQQKSADKYQKMEEELLKVGGAKTPDERATLALFAKLRKEAQKAATELFRSADAMGALSIKVTPR